MGKGLCCAAQKAGDLGKPLIITILRANGTTSQACGVCEIGQSCRNPQKQVFQFRRLPGVDCNLTTGKCSVTAAGLAQYNQIRAQAPVTGEVPLLYQYPVTPGGEITFTPRPPVGRPYSLPLP